MKQAVGHHAVDLYVKSNMTIGLGTGSTVFYSIQRLGEGIKDGKFKNICAIPTSEQTRIEAEKNGIKLIDLNETTIIDIAIDGADEVDESIQLVKGRGGALLREKLIEKAAKKFIVIVDHTKFQPDGLGLSGPMPVEIMQFGHRYIMNELLNLPCLKGVARAKIRTLENGEPYLTDNSNMIVGLYFDAPIKNVCELANELKSVTGVIEHGLFTGFSDILCLVAQPDGSVITKKRF
eukprot:GHVL01028326.1.p1 GENE.GHVL01028326.1~~GHVL01028326.1.p1  ORF type:complete len:235 (+),score=46.72 GHVL01028326.1:858-1562(+)